MFLKITYENTVDIMNNPLNITFQFKAINVGSKEIHDFVCFYKTQLQEKQQQNFKLDFCFGELVENIDELLYAYILLFINDYPNSTICFNFSRKDKTSSIAIQQIGYVNIYKNPKTAITVTEQGVLTKEFTTASKDFFPFLLINKNTCGSSDINNDLFIENSFSLNEFISLINAGDLTKLETCFTNKDEFLKQMKNIRNEKPRSISDLSWHYLFNTLSSLNVLRYFFEKNHNTGKNYRAGHLTQEWSDKLIKKIAATLENQEYFKFNYVKIFIFSLLVENSKQLSISSDQKGSQEFIEEYKKHLVHLIKETNDIVLGLEEAAKNMVEHTGKSGEKSGFGVISARIHKKGKAEILKDETLQTWCKKKEKKNGTGLLFLDINIIDSGRESVATKYISNLEYEILKYSENQEEPYTTLKKELENDLQRIKDEKYTFSRFLNYQKIELQHQIKRANARLGLLIFSNLVIERKLGIVKIASTDLFSNKPDCAYMFLEGEYLLEDKSNTPNVFNILGTNYNFIIPIEYSNIFIGDIFEDGDKGTPTSTLKELFNYKIINYEEVQSLNKDNKIFIIQNVPIPEQSDKYEKIYAYSKTIIDINKKQKNSLILIDAQRVNNFILNSSDWTRLLACIQFSNDSPLIIYNIEFKIQQEIIAINRIYDSIKEFWNDNNFTLFYTKYKYTYEHRRKINDKTQEVTLWFCDILSGKTFDKYLSMNRSISHYHHNLFSIIDHKTGNENDFSHPIKTKSKLFSKDGKLLNFELLIICNNDLTLYEESVQSLLNIEICTLPDKNLFNDNIEKIEKFFYKFKGYKVSNSHFKLGSKIHISDFYYAKRIFYNSFYANRFAFLVAKYVLNNHLLNEKKDERISLIGYSRYSELLVSNTRRLLEEQKYAHINHDVILEDGRVLKNASKINEKVIIIIPISSTFSTSDKIKKWLDVILIKHGNKKHHLILNTDINVLLVADKNFENFYLKENRLYEEFRWQRWKENDFNARTLEKKEINNVSICYEKYFIPLLTEWQAIYECKFCFPNMAKGEREKCLLETSANSVSPESIFGFPISRTKVLNEGLTFNIYIGDNNKPLVLQRHIKRDNKHYKQYIRAGSFLIHNKDIIKAWLSNLSKKNILNYYYENVVIITPSNTANSGFVNMVNEYLFSDTATVLQYSTTDDILQNFISFNASFFYNSIVLFIDDVLHTANSFHLINNYIKSIPYKNGEHRTIDHCLCIINRLGYFDEQNVLNSLSKKINQKGEIFSFVELDIPSIKQPNYEFPDVVKGLLFTDLANSSVTDMMKLHFYELNERIKAYDVDQNSKEPSSELIHLFNFLIYKALQSFFSGKFVEGPEFDYSDKKIESFIENEKSTILEVLLKHVNKDKDVNNFLNYEIGRKFKYEVETRVIYLCSTPPFTYYKDIKESAFEWIEKKLGGLQSEIINNEQNNTFFENFFQCKKYDTDLKKEISVAFCDYQTFKLYLRLSVELKSNNIFSIELLKAVRILLTKLSSSNPYHYYSYEKKIIIDQVNNKQSTIYDILDDKKYVLKATQEKEISPIGFITYYTGLVQQLIYKDEAKATKLVKNVVEFVRELKIGSENEYLTLRNDFSNHFINLLRILVLENTFIFNVFQKNFHEEEKKLDKYTFELDEKESQFISFKDIINKYKGQASRFSAVNKMLIKYNFDFEEFEQRDKDLEEAFKKTIYLKTLLKNEIENKHNGGDIQQKVRIILEYLSDIMDITKNKCSGGAFFTIRYKNLNKNVEDITSDDLYTIYNYATTNDNEINENLTLERSLVFELYRGIKEKGSKKPDSTFEILYNDENNKYDSISIVNSISEDDLNVNSGYTETKHNQHYNNIFFLRVTEIKEDNLHLSVFEELLEVLNNDGFDEFTFKKELKKVNKDLRESIWKKISKISEEVDLRYDEANKYSLLLKDILLEEKDKIIFKTNPLAVLCFYKCNLKEKNICLNCDKTFCNRKENNKRLDPKRLRFLLLLRDDIKDFINYHLTNDSFRAFVEKEHRGEYMFSLSHGVDTYEHMISSYILKIKESNNKLLVSELETAIFYLTNKLHLISNVTKFISGEFTKDDINNKNTLGEFINHFETKYEMILTFENEQYPKGDLDCIIFCNDINTGSNSLEFFYPEALMDEIAFEIIYNIRKYVIGRTNTISVNNKLIIRLELVKLNSIIFLRVANNHSNRSDASIDRLNNRFKSRTFGINGLDLIYNCLYVLFKNDNLHISIEDKDNVKYFAVWIPLKKLN
jgi:hypothetical protein